jgi:preprotein translocase subunit SecA
MLENAEGDLASLQRWMQDRFQCELRPEDVEEFNRPEMLRQLIATVEDRYRPEMRKMERQVLLERVDESWKQHLLAMDKLKSSVGLMGYAQLDAKVEYKREGMRTFETMWDEIGEQATDLVFRMESFDEGFVKSTFVERAAMHESAPTLSDEQRQTQQTIDSVGKDDVKPEPIRNRGQRTGRNDPCPCGSGKKYKNCHMRGTNP